MQFCVATSTTDVGYVSTSESVKKILQLRNITKEIQGKKLNITIYANNQASKCIMEYGEINKKLKYIDIRYHVNRNNILKIRIYRYRKHARRHINKRFK